jgi:phosphoenolpyruvate-protein phosphotransferase (PTS system enzyme I)
MSQKTLRGISASTGIAIGPVWRYEILTRAVAERHIDDVAAEQGRLEAALGRARKEIQALTSQVQQDAGSSNAAIFEAHEMFLSDPELLEQVRAMIETRQIDAEYAWQASTEQYASLMRSISDEYLAARATDVEDVARRVLRILQGVDGQAEQPVEPAIIVATELTPSDTVAMDKQKVLAFCTARGGPTSHVAILAKALGIPAIVGLGDASAQLRNGLQVIVDGPAGEVLLGPDAATLAAFRSRAETLERAQSEALMRAQEPGVTADGVRVEIVANIGSADEAAMALQAGAEGVGLLRTEFLFLQRESAPDEDEQAAVYASIMQVMGQRPVVVRTLDIGGDKPAPYLDLPPEMNPFLGVRGLRLSLAHPDLFQAQLRALLRAGVGHNLKLMFPMVATRGEVLAAREQLVAARMELAALGRAYAQAYEVGIMVEVPAAAMLAEVLAEVVDFFSIGTNDLSQYTLAADRTNAEVASLADAFHPAVLRLVRMVIEAAHAHKKWVGLCGELAADPLAAPVLLGLGLDEFSMTARSIPLVKATLRRYSLSEAGEIARHALALGDAAEVRAYLKSISKL